MAILGAALVAAAAGAGCASNQDYKPIDSYAAFQHQILTAEKPVLVDFTKEGCVACVSVEPVLAQLAEEYRGKVIFTRMELLKADLDVVSERIRVQYKIEFYPTQILFVKGQARYRWVLDYNLDDYRSILDQAVAMMAKPTAPRSKAPAAGKS